MLYVVYVICVDRKVDIGDYTPCGIVHYSLFVYSIMLNIISMKNTKFKLLEFLTSKITANSSNKMTGK